MKDTSQKPPLLTEKSLTLITKFMAIYTAFHIVTVLFKSYADAVSDQPTVAEQYQFPIYVIAGIHLIMGLICGAMIMTKKYYWVVTISCIVISLYTRFFFEDIVSFINA